MGIIIILSKRTWYKKEIKISLLTSLKKIFIKKVRIIIIILNIIFLLSYSLFKLNVKFKIKYTFFFLFW